MLIGFVIYWLVATVWAFSVITAPEDDSKTKFGMLLMSVLSGWMVLPVKLIQKILR